MADQPNPNHPIHALADVAPMSGEELRQAREELGHAAGEEVTQTDLGAILGFSQKHMSRLEKGQNDVQQLTAVAVRLLLDRARLACAEGIDVDAVLAEYGPR